MLKIGTKLTLMTKHSEIEEKYKCKLVERKDNQLFIDYPINETTGRTSFLIDGTQLRGVFIGEDSAVYLFDTEVLGRTKQQIPMIILDDPGNDEFVKIQRRQYVRVDTSIDLAIHPEFKEFSPFTTISTDLSAGGASFSIPEDNRLLEGGIIQVYLILPMQSGEFVYLKIPAEIVRIEKGEKGTRDRASIKFEDMLEKDRQTLMKFCFERQLNNKRKNRLK